MLSILSFSLVAFALPKWHELEGYTFYNYVRDFKREYAIESEEWHMRRKLFEGRLEGIKKHNQDPSATYKKGVNQFTDMTEKERNVRLGIAKHLLFHEAGNAKPSETNDDKKQKAYPSSIDWRDKNVITAVKDQGQCGSCWAFASTETLESHTAIQTGFLEEVSVGQFVSCTPNPEHCGGWGGCSGATVQLAYAYGAKNGGLTTEWIWGYESYWGSNGTCHFNNRSGPGGTPVKVKLTGHQTTKVNDLDSLYGSLMDGPVAVSVDASTWFEYESGIYSGCSTRNIDLDHAVQLVGYGEEKGNAYWTIRNSWSPTWGEKGYIRIPRTPSGQRPPCGIDFNPHDGDACLPAPPNITVCGYCGVLYGGVWPTGLSVVTN